MKFCGCFWSGGWEDDFGVEFPFFGVGPFFFSRRFMGKKDKLKFLEEYEKELETELEEVRKRIKKLKEEA